MSETPEDHAAELAAWRKEAAGAFADLAAEFGIGAKTNLSVDQISAALRKRLEHARLPMHDRLGMIVEALGLVAGDTKWGDLTWNDVVGGVKALKERVEKAEAGLERFREVVEAKLPEYAPKADAPPDEVADERQRCQDELHAALGGCAWRSWAEMLTEVRTLANPEGVAKREVCEVSRTIGGTSYACTLTMGHDGHHRQDGEQGASWPNHAGSCDARCGYFELPRGCAVVDTQRLASLRAELTALGKHVEDVERRAYASPTNDALTVELGHNINAPPGQIITTGERLDSLERRVSDNTDALALWQGAVDRLAAKVDAAVELGAKRWSDLGAIVARLGELGEADQKRLDVLVVGCVPPVPSMTLKEAAEMMGAPRKPQTIAEATLAQHRGLSQDVEPLEIAAAMCGRRGAPKVPGFYQGLDVSTSGPITFPVVGVQPVALRPSDDDPRDRAELLEELLAARLGSGNPSAPFDLATLRVPTSETDGTVVLIAEDGRLVITDDVGNNVGVAQLPPTSARLLARMLMQSADAEEAKGASPQAYEPDSEDGS